MTATSRHFHNDSCVKLVFDIVGEATGDNFGRQVALSDNGTIVAIGAPNDGENSGHVRVLQLVEGSWERMGEDIYGEADDDEFGCGFGLSVDGSIVAIGAPCNDDGYGYYSGHVRVYKYDGSSWNILEDLYGEAASDFGDRSGASVSLSANGFIVALGAESNNYDSGDLEYSGHVRIYKYDGFSWIQLRGDLDREGEYDESGASVSLSEDGSNVAIGAPYYDSGHSCLSDGNSGHVRIYKFDGSSSNQLGGDLYGEAAGDLSGISIDLSDDGSIVAIGATLNNGDNGKDSGHVRIYNYNGSSWNKVGGDLNGEGAYDRFGISVALSSDGSIVAIGGVGIGGVGGSLSRVHVHIYKFDGASWDQLGRWIWTVKLTMID